MKQTEKMQVFAGGLAEMCPHPSDLTYSYLSRWFRPDEAYGKAINLLGLPLFMAKGPLVILHNGQLVVDVSLEEKVLYGETVFKYKFTRNMRLPPQLSVSLTKLKPQKVWNSLKILMIHSQWLAHQSEMVTTASGWLTEAKKVSLREEEPERKITSLLPVQVAIGILAEYYRQMLERESGRHFNQYWNLVSAFLSEHDWFMASYRDQYAVQEGLMSFAHYLEEYGLRADDEYELTCPRWFEIPKVIEERIAELPAKKGRLVPRVRSSKHAGLVATCSQFQLLRSEVKRALLEPLSLLRQAGANGRNNQPLRAITRKRNHVSRKKVSGQGKGVSPGRTSGTATFIHSPATEITSGIIGVFPDASPRFAHLYSRCKGMIFLKGGVTSHGAIVARELGIPALIDDQAQQLVEGQPVRLDGLTGTWLGN